MKGRIRLLGTGVFAAVAAAVSGAAAAPVAREGLREGGYVPYLLGRAEGGPIVGGGHLVLVPSTGGREPFDAPNHPRRLHPSLAGEALLFRPEIRSGETDLALFASSWWPSRHNGIAARWHTGSPDDLGSAVDPDDLSPVEKYDRLFYPGQEVSIPEIRSFPVEELERPPSERSQGVLRPAITVAGPATAWEVRRHGLYQLAIPESWWGHCNGWASYAVVEALGAPQRDVRARLAGDQLAECAPGEAGCVLFRMADIEALMSEVYYSDASTLAGRRCDEEPDRIARDPYGRPTSAACRDLSPATLHVALAALQGVGAPPLGAPAGAAARRLAFVMDVSAEREVWNFPIQRFAFAAVEEVDAAEAASLVCAGGRAGPLGCMLYRFNENAVRFVRVEARVWLISDEVSRADLLRPAAEREVPLEEVELHYVLELDGAGTILGGEWIRSPAVTTGLGSTEAHPDFLWLPYGPVGAGEGDDDRGGEGDNPHLDLRRVRALLALSRTPAPGR